MTTKLTLAEFAKIAEAVDVKIEAGELEEMREGYLGLKKMLEKLPQKPDFFDEPAVVFMTSDRAIK